MIVRMFWRGCRFRRKNYQDTPVDSFWVEATGEEAEKLIFPFLEAEEERESRMLAEGREGISALLGGPGRNFCFLVSRDISSIDPFPVFYPSHQLWNGYSPFETMPEQEIRRLEDLVSMGLPLSKAQ